MNIDNNFYCAGVFLEKAREKVSEQNYRTALVSLGKAYSHTRQLLEQVSKLHALKSDVKQPAGEDAP